MIKTREAQRGCLIIWETCRRVFFVMDASKKYKLMRFCSILFMPVGCSTTHKSSLEKDFEHRKIQFISVDLDWNVESCRGAGATAYMHNAEIVMIASEIGTSRRVFYYEFYFKDNHLLMAIQRVWYMIDHQGDDLKKPTLESETRYFYEDNHCYKKDGILSTEGIEENGLLEMADELMKLAQVKMKNHN